MSYPAVQKNPNREVEYTYFSGVLSEERACMWKFQDQGWNFSTGDQGKIMWNFQAWVLLGILRNFQG